MKKLSLFLFIILCGSLSARKVTYYIACKDGGCSSQINNLINVIPAHGEVARESCKLVSVTGMGDNLIDETCFKESLVPAWNAKDKGVNNKGFHSYTITLNL